MRRFVKRADIAVVVLPGYGRVLDGVVLEGNYFGEYAPRLLTELVEEQPTVEPVVETPVGEAPVEETPAPTKKTRKKKKSADGA